MHFFRNGNFEANIIQREFRCLEHIFWSTSMSQRENSTCNKINLIPNKKSNSVMLLSHNQYDLQENFKSVHFYKKKEAYRIPFVSKFSSETNVFSFTFSEHEDSVSLESGLLSCKSIQELSEITDDLMELQCYSHKKMQVLE